MFGIACLLTVMPLAAPATPQPVGLTSAASPVTLLLLGSALTLLGGFFAQTLVVFFTRRHEQMTLLVGVSTELKLLRENLGSELEGFREALRYDEHPRLDGFAVLTPILDANVGQLGQLHDLALVEQIVEVYDNLLALRAKARLYEKIPLSKVGLVELNDMHLSATLSHLMVIKLHNRLRGAAQPAQRSTSATEQDTRKLVAEYEAILTRGGLAELLHRSWTDQAANGGKD